MNNNTNLPADTLYTLIRAALDADGHLPPGFSLPDNTPDNQLSFAPGAMDGIGVYHMAPQDTAEQSAFVADWVRRACKGADEAEMATITTFLGEHRVLHLADGLLGNIREDYGDITPNEVYALAHYLMTGTGHVELVKLGIVLSGLLNLEGNAEFRDVLLTLGGYDEFTLYALVAVGSWADADDLIFDYAQTLRGWGKVHAVERLDPKSEVVRSWIIQSGCRNDVTDAYLALTCAHKGDLVGHLRPARVTDALFEGAGVILSALLDEGPVPGISAYEAAGEAIEHYLRHAEGREDLTALSVVLDLMGYLEDCDLPERDGLLSRCKAIVGKPCWGPLIAGSVEIGDNSSLGPAHRAAEAIGMNINPGLFARLEADPMGLVYLVLGLMRDPDYTDRVLFLYEKALPLGDMATGMGDLMGLGPAYRAHGCLDQILQCLGQHPGKGLVFIHTGLSSPVVRNRNMALAALGAWCESGRSPGDFDPALPGRLDTLHSEEVNAETKARIGALTGLQA